MKIFEVKPNPKYDIVIRLAVCDTWDEAMQEANKHLRKEGSNSRWEGRTQAMFCPTYQKADGGVPGIFTNNVFGTCFLNRKNITLRIVAHELAHGAFSYMHDIRHYRGDFDDDDLDQQEEFCYFLGDAVAAVMEIIKKHYKGAV